MKTIIEFFFVFIIMLGLFVLIVWVTQSDPIVQVVKTIIKFTMIVFLIIAVFFIPSLMISRRMRGAIVFGLMGLSSKELNDELCKTSKEKQCSEEHGLEPELRDPETQV